MVRVRQLRQHLRQRLCNLVMEVMCMITKTITLSDRRVNAASIKIGNEGDNNAERIKFVLPARLASATVFLFLSIDEYSDVVRLDDVRTFTPERKHTQYPGKWTAYLQAVADGDVVWHSDTFPLLIGNLPPTGQQIEQQYPTAIEEALKAVDTLTGVDARAETLPAGSEATVSFEEDENGNRTIVFGIPRGRDGTGGEGGIYFTTDETLVLDENNVLRVNTTDVAEADNTQPITSAGVQMIVGNINAILETI